MPKNTKTVVGKILDQYYRLDPVTGKPTRTFVFPNVSQLRKLTDALAAVTEKIEAKLEEMTDMSWSDLWIPESGTAGWMDYRLALHLQEGRVTWGGDFEAWKTRLAGYRAALVGKPPNAEISVRWSVTFPLLFGMYGGLPPGIDERRLPYAYKNKVWINREENGQVVPVEIPLDHGPPDVATPFSLLRQLKISDAWARETSEAFLGDLGDAAVELYNKAKHAAEVGLDVTIRGAKGLGIGLGIGAVVLGGYLLLRK